MIVHISLNSTIGITNLRVIPIFIVYLNCMEVIIWIIMNYIYKEYALYVMKEEYQ